MKQWDKIETLVADLEVDFSAKEGYSVLTKKERNRLAGKPPDKRGFSLLIRAVILGRFVLGLFALVAVLFQHPSNVESGSTMRSLGRRIKQLEERLDRIEADLEQIKEKNKQVNTFMKTFGTLERPPKGTPAQTAKIQTKAVYHELVAGEILYRISRRYGLTVDELRSLNKLESGAIIYPAQRLLIRPADQQ